VNGTSVELGVTLVFTSSGAAGGVDTGMANASELATLVRFCLRKKENLASGFLYS
jgi:hypothetical protein